MLAELGWLALLLLASSGAVLGWLISGSAQEMHFSDLMALATIMLIVVTVQSSIAAVLGLVAGRWRTPAARLAFAAFFGLNVYFFALLAVEAPVSVRMVSAAAAGIVFLVLILFRSTRALTLVFSLVFTLVSLGQFVVGKAESLIDPQVDVASLEVKSDRNVYLISMESLHSPHALRELYSVGGGGHIDYLEGVGFRVLDRAYSADTATRTSFQRMLEFNDPLKWVGFRNMVLTHGNSTFESFRDSGYGVQFMYISNYLGLNPELVDYAFPPDGYYLCDNLPEDFMFIACRPPVVKFINLAMFKAFGAVSPAEQIEKLKERVSYAAGDDQPWLTINHIAFPQHTEETHRFDSAQDLASFRSLYRGLLPQVEANYRSIMDFIIADDPDAVIVTYGDHGSWLTRGMPVHPEAAEPFTVEDFIEDRYGVMLAVYPADFCESRIFSGSATTTLVYSLIKCLSGDDEPTPSEIAKSREVVAGADRITLDDFVPLPRP